MSRAISEGWQRLRELHTRRPAVGDVALVAVLLVLTAGPHIGDLPQSAGSRAFAVALVVPLLGRRRWPVAVFGVIAALCFVQYLADVRTSGDAALLVALYTVALTQRRLVVAGAGVVMGAGALLAATRWSPGAVVQEVVALAGLSTAAAVAGTSARNRRALVSSLQERAERLERERDAQGRLAAAAERARIARELHDIVAHNVSVMIALADGATYAMADDPARAEQAMRTASRTGRQSLTEMRRLLGVLRDQDEHAELVPQPGLGELEALVEDVRTAGLPVAYVVDGQPGEAPAPGLQLAVYRIVQEALTNTLKHAGPAATAALRVRHAPASLQVEVTDTGRAAPAVAAGTGAGLRGMRERAAVYDGTVSAGPAADGGWRVHLEVPLAPAAVAAA